MMGGAENVAGMAPMAIEVEGLSFAYRAAGRGRRAVLRQVGFAVGGGQLVALLGPNGVGKSTLFKCILGLLPRQSGTITVGGVATAGLPAAKLAKMIAYVPQNPYPAFNYSVMDMVLMGTTAQVGSFSSPGAAQRRAAERALEQLGIAGLAGRGFLHLSGGERQLVLLARALAQQARLLVMDEPTAGLDYGNALRVLGRIKALAAEGYTAIVSTHDPQHALWFAHRVLAMQGGRIVADGPPETVLTGELIGRLYGMRVSLARPQAGGPVVCLPQLAPPE